MKKILFSPGFGAGWSSWMNGVPAKFACEYQPIIDAIERGEYLDEHNHIIIHFVEECKRLFRVSYVSLGGLDSLCVAEIKDGSRYRIGGYDGNERIELESKSENEWN